MFENDFRNLQQNARTAAAAAVSADARNVRAVNGGGFTGVARAIRHANDQANGLSQTLTGLAGLATAAFIDGKVIEHQATTTPLSVGQSVALSPDRIK